jgi:hypothetical protein
VSGASAPTRGRRHLRCPFFVLNFFSWQVFHAVINMSSASNIYEPAYASSHALVIGINNYRHVSPLARAANDAKAVAKTLIEKFGFPTANVSLLIDDKATRAKITKEYLSLANSPKVSINDRVIIFFAGHGHTVSGRRETGFLVPVDGKIDDLATLVRWDELTRNADLIPAKHILFLMDACYGGLAVTRKIPPGSSRYLEDMLTRLTRQVVTAGKANETVSDGGGTRPDHSIFTSNLLDALDGAAASTPGVITAMGVMAYVYEKVGNDPNSNQTPHFGFIDGDGDLIFQMPEREIVGTKGYDTLIKAPQFNPADEVKPLSVGEQIKLLVPDQSARIRLDDFVTSQLRTTLQAISPTKFPSQGQPVSELPRIFADYVGQYEKEVRNIQTVLIQLCRWAEPGQLPLIQRIFQTIGEQPELRGGFTMLANLDWYPSACSMYAGGISALAAGRFDSLRACMLTEVKEPSVRGNATKPIIVPVGYAIAEL